jgi:hypothetical protein
LQELNGSFAAHVQRRSPQAVATLDMDATLVQSTKQQALYSYKGFKAYQPLQTYWFEQDLVLHSEFRDGKRFRQGMSNSEFSRRRWNSYLREWTVCIFVPIRPGISMTF